MLFRPVYLKGKRMQEAPIPMAKPPSPKAETPPPPPSPQPPEPPEIQEPPEEEPQVERIPLLVCGDGVTAVFPKEATRDVLSGRVDYFLVDERGVTMFHKKHIFAALKLGKEQIEKYEDFPCVGAHQRLLDRRPQPKKIAKYRRRYICPELIGRGVYGKKEASWSSPGSQRRMSSDSLYGGYAGPRA